MWKRYTAGFFEHLMVHFPPAILARDSLVQVVGCNVLKGFGHAKEYDLEVVRDGGHAGGMSFAAGCEVQKESGRLPDLFYHTNQMAMVGFVDGTAQYIQAWDLSVDHEPAYFC